MITNYTSTMIAQISFITHKQNEVVKSINIKQIDKIHKDCF
jgi:hypothetical protein